MKITLPNMLIYIFAKWCSYFSLKKRANIFIKSIRLASKKEPIQAKPKFLLELENYIYAEQQKAAVKHGDGIHPNLTFVQGDATKDLPNKKFDVVILSNVLEQIKNRIDFLKEIVNKASPSRLLVRVPVFEREWRTAFKKELGLDYRLDDTH